MHIVVLGAGVVGVTTAYYLTERGHTVTVVERAAAFASGASCGNGGQLSYSFTDALASPALLSKLPGIIAGANPAFYVHPRVNTQLLGWGLDFLRQCTVAKNQKNTVAVLKLALRSGELMEKLRTRTLLEFSHRRASKLVMMDGPKALEEARGICDLKNRHGCDAEPISLERAIDLEPALAHMNNKYVGAIYSQSDEVGDSLVFTSRLGKWLSDNHDVEFLMNTTVLDITARGGKLTTVETDSGPLTPDAVVVCLGAWSYELLQKLGITARIYPMRGYSVTLPSLKTSNFVSITDPGSKTVFTRLGDQVRIAGFADFVGYRTAKDDTRARTLIETAQKTAPKIGDFSAKSINQWGGFRPMTPNSQPLLGPCAIEGEEMAMRIAERVVGITDKLKIPYVFKGSFKKASFFL